jgi:hypothetical protein
MEYASENSDTAVWKTVLRSLRPAIPAVIGAAALTFLFAAVMPFAWVAGISWNLYLDRLSDLFLQPIGNGGRLALALGMAAVAALIAGIVALVVAKPEETGFSALRRRMRRSGEAGMEADDEDALPRRRADLHPDDPPRPPIRAGRDLPAEGLGPLVMPAAVEAYGEADIAFAEPVDEYDYGDELMLAELAPVEPAPTGDEPWLQPAEMTAAPAAITDPADNSLSALVARLEAGLARRRVEPAASTASPVPDAATAPANACPEADFALEAALGTLQRMTRHAAG